MDGIATYGTGLALGGGTARGMAHVGVLKASAAAGEPPVALAGTSFGAIVAAMAGLGMTAREIEKAVRSINVMELWAQAIDFGLHEAALIRGQRLANWMDRTIFYGATLDEVVVPTAIAATDLATGRLVVLRSGPVVEAVRASCALPGIFAPVTVDGRHLVDGGFVEPVPFAALATLQPARSIGVHAGLDMHGAGALSRLRRLDAGVVGRTVHALGTRASVEGPWGRLARGLSLSLASYAHDVSAPEGADLIAVSPGVAWWDFHRAQDAIVAGERAMRRYLAERDVALLGPRTRSGTPAEDATVGVDVRRRNEAPS